MSAVTILCPNGHRQKVSTTPNMSLLQIMETVCKKKGFEPDHHKLQHHRKNLDLSLSFRFSGLPNNAALELVELEESEKKSAVDSNVTVCLQIPCGERLIQEFTSTSTMEAVLDTWREKLGQPQEGEESVVVYMRTEMVGPQLKTSTLRSLGLTSGKGLFRFFYKKPEMLKDQAKVYDMKVSEKIENKDDKQRHLPMRLEASTLKYEIPEPSPANIQTTKPATEGQVEESSAINPVPGPSSSTSSSTTASSPAATTEAEKSKASSSQVPDSTSCQIDPVLIPVGPHDAVIYSGTDASNAIADVDDDESFFQHSLEEVKAMYKELRLAVKEVDEGAPLLTKAMQESQREGEKLSVLGRYKTGVLRVQFPNRFVVQGTFKPADTIGEVMEWLRPLLDLPDTPFELYTAPPRTVLDEKSSLLDLNLFPAALVHYSCKVTSEATVNQSFIKPEYTVNLSNLQGANMAVSEYRKGGKPKPQTGISEGTAVMRAEKLDSIPESRTADLGPAPATSANPAPKMPKWFKPGK